MSYIDGDQVNFSINLT